MNRLRSMRTLGVAGFALATGLGVGTAWAYTAPYATPAGITLVDVSSGTGSSTPEFLWRRLGDATGNPLYTYDADQGGKSSCYDECAKQFPPFVAPAHASASGDFRILVRDDHVKQWVYQGKPLYRYSGRDPRGEVRNDFFSGPHGPALDPASKIYSPKQGWRRAAYTPEKSTAMPPDVQLDALAPANGFGFVDAATDMAIYAAPVSHKLSSDWKPVRAGALELPVGEFSIINRKDDGTRQWTYRGEALYTYAGDYAPGEVTGIFTGDKRIQAALAYRNFLPPGVQINSYVGRGPLMTTSKGLTLYFVARFIGSHGGRDTRHGGYGVTYNDAKSQGTEGCQGDCTKSWPPLLARANAQSRGFWEVVARPDGSKQWAFKGSPVYSFVGDKPGDTAGNNRSVIVYGGSNDQVVYAHAEADPHFPQPLIGKLSMAFAVAPVDEDKLGAGAGTAKATPAAGTGGGAAAARARLHFGPRGEGAGLYWHTVGLSY